MILRWRSTIHIMHLKNTVNTRNKKTTLLFIDSWRKHDDNRTSRYQFCTHTAQNENKSWGRISDETTCFLNGNSHCHLINYNYWNSLRTDWKNWSDCFGRALCQSQLKAAGRLAAPVKIVCRRDNQLKVKPAFSQISVSM